MVIAVIIVFVTIDTSLNTNAASPDLQVLVAAYLPSFLACRFNSRHLMDWITAFTNA